MGDASYSFSVNVKDRFTAPFKSFQSSSDKYVKQIKEQQSAIKDLKNTQKDLQQFDRLDAKLKQTGAALEIARNDVSQLQGQFDASAKPTKKLTRELGKAKARVSQLAVDFKVQTNVTANLNAKLSKAGLNTAKFANEQKRLESATERANEALKAQKQKVKALGDARSKIDANRAARSELQGQVIGAAATAYVASKPIKAAVNYESSMADVAKVVDFEGGKKGAEYKKMQSDILQMSTKIPLAASGIAEIVAAAGQSGVAKKELLSFAESAAKMSVAFDVGASEAGSTMAAWRASMNLSQQQAVDLADATNHLSNKMNAKAPDVANVLKRQGAVAMSAGLSATQAASFAAALLSGGASEEVAATALKNITGAMMKGDTGTNKQKAAFAQLGFDPGQLSSEMISDAPSTIIDVFKAMEDVPEEEMNSLVSSLFGEEVKGSVMPLLKNLGNLEKAFKLTSDATSYKNSMEKEFLARSDTSANKLQLLNNSFQRMQINLGTLLLPTLNSIVAPLASFTDKLAVGAQEYPRIAQGIMMVTAALVAAKVAYVGAKLLGLKGSQGKNYFNLMQNKMAASTDRSAKSASVAARSIAQFNNQLDKAGHAGSDKRSKRGRKGKKGKLGKLKQLGGKVFRPAALVAGGVVLSSAVAAGDIAGAGGAAGNIGGGLAGVGAGAIAGAALGSVVPILGTAVGGVVGSILGGLGGSALGDWAGSKLGSLFSSDEKDKPKLEQNTLDLTDISNKLSPDSELKKITNQTRSNANQISFAPHINIKSTGNEQDDERLLNKLMERLKSELVPVMTGDGLDTRLNNSLSDGVTS